MLCNCGCGEELLINLDGKYNSYRPGHDSKHKSRLMALSRSGDVGHQDAEAILIEKGWSTADIEARFRAEMTAKIQREAQKRDDSDWLISQLDKVVLKMTLARGLTGADSPVIEQSEGNFNKEFING